MGLKEETAKKARVMGDLRDAAVKCLENGIPIWKMLSIVADACRLYFGYPEQQTRRDDSEAQGLKEE